MLDRLKSLVSLVKQMEASDLHLLPNQPPALRVMGELRKLDDFLDTESTKAMFNTLLELLPEDQRAFVKNKMSQHYACDFSVSLDGLRFRVNASRKGVGYYIVLRTIKSNPPTLRELGLPADVVEALEFVMSRPSGLFLVVGPTGSGKSTTLAALVRYINEKKAVNIITLEDPIEYIHTPQLAQIVQKELGQDFPRFADGLHAALREDPDVILVGEIRDQDSYELCLKAAETGHLVLSTLHTEDTVETVHRLAVMGKYGEQWVRDRLAQSLIGVIAQKLVKKKDDSGRVPVVEVLVMNNAMKNMIKEGKDFQIRAMLDTTQYCSSFNKNIADLYSRGVITREMAFMLTRDVQDLQSKLRGGRVKPRLTGHNFTVKT